MATRPTGLAKFLAEQALPFLVHNWTVCLLLKPELELGFVAISLGPTIPSTKLDCLSLAETGTWIGFFAISLGCALTVSSFRQSINTFSIL
jgi:hypothetical protein